MDQGLAARPEQTFLIEGGIQVTNARFVANGQTFAMANITSVRRVAPKRGTGIVVALLGLLFTAVVPIIGIPMIIIGVLLAIFAKATIVLVTAGGEAEAYAGSTKMVDAIVVALNNAIIHRG